SPSPVFADRSVQFAGQLLLGCPSKAARQNVVTGEVHLAYGQSTCSLFDGTTVDETVQVGRITLSLGEWHNVQGTYQADLLELKIKDKGKDKRLYVVWPFDFDTDLIEGDPPAVGFGFLPNVSYQNWNESDHPKTSEVMIANRDPR
ncbi:MAG: hypothetical protein WDZ68_01550, partial [Candidatus Paceibacterota bacterium]